MTPFNDDLHPRLVSEPFTYNFSALGRVSAAPITLANELVGYIFHGSEEEPGSAGVLLGPDHNYESEQGRFWHHRLRDSFARGVLAREAVTSLLGIAGPGNSGTVGTALVERSGKRELEDELNPERARRRAGAEARSRGRQESEDVGTRIPVMTLRSEMDAVLRGEISPSEQMRKRVAQFDEVLSRRPTPEAIIVTLTPAIARIPEGLESGSRVFEPSFTTSYLMPTKQLPPGEPVVLRLTVPAGVPAHFFPPASEGAAGMLLLGRGLEWEVRHVVQLAEHLVIFGYVINVRPEHISPYWSDGSDQNPCRTSRQ